MGGKIDGQTDRQMETDRHVLAVAIYENWVSSGVNDTLEINKANCGVHYVFIPI